MSLISGKLIEMVEQIDLQWSGTFAERRFAEVAQEWHDAGFPDPEDVNAWAKVGFWSPSHAQAAAQAGLEPEDAEAMCNLNKVNIRDGICNNNETAPWDPAFEGPDMEPRDSQDLADLWWQINETGENRATCSETERNEAMEWLHQRRIPEYDLADLWTRYPKPPWSKPHAEVEYRRHTERLYHLGNHFYLSTRLKRSLNGAEAYDLGIFDRVPKLSDYTGVMPDGTYLDNGEEAEPPKEEPVVRRVASMSATGAAAALLYSAAAEVFRLPELTDLQHPLLCLWLRLYHLSSEFHRRETYPYPAYWLRDTLDRFGFLIKLGFEDMSLETWENTNEQDLRDLFSKVGEVMESDMTSEERGELEDAGAWHRFNTGSRDSDSHDTSLFPPVLFALWANGTVAAVWIRTLTSRRVVRVDFTPGGNLASVTVDFGQRGSERCAADIISRLEVPPELAQYLNTVHVTP